MRIFLAIATAALIALTATPSVAAQLVTDLSEHQVRIRSNFTGTQILLFGAIEVNTANERSLDHDVVVVVTGPSRAVTVRRKDRVAGIWINTESITFPNVPGYYAVASSRPLEVTAEVPVLQREQIGIDNVNFGTPLVQGIDGSRQILSVDDEKNFIKALVRNKRREKLYSSDPGGIIFLGQTLFRATVEIPANVPVGLYTATVFLIADGQVVDAISSPLYIDKSGLERFLYRFAHNDALLYGIIAVFGAALAGWLGSAVLRQR